MGTGSSPARRVEARLLGAVAVGLSLLQLTRLVSPPDPPVGADIAPFAAAAALVIPPGAGYLYVQPGAFGQDLGDDPRLRYDLYPRVYENVRVAEGAEAARAVARRQRLSYILLPRLERYPADSWVLRNSDWFRRVPTPPGGAILVVQDGQ